MTDYSGHHQRYRFDGKNLTITQWAKVTGINVYTLRDRIRQYNWPIERALTEPVNRNNFKRKGGTE